ncbi:hypothetical protein [Paenibacillus elgii]|uniref:hypothetical protein n=1 Tax=Paenibacillus elgii TaxID=189691 RepID=UPI00204044EA|nr:hypothetical protein [Paenibacillus elgii]MCM3268447.1 hypothetical protein [Paenibacillus elgii]
MKKGVLILAAAAVCIGLGSLPVRAGAPAAPAKLTFVVQASPESAMRSELTVRSPKLLKKLLPDKVRPVQQVPLTDVYAVLEKQGAVVRYAIDAHGNWYDTQHRQSLELPQVLKDRLHGYAEAVRAAHYGQLASWEEARKTVAMKAVCRIVDLETGLAFQAQRRAGSSHADMQPLTKADTAVMKEIYKGAWSWKRRAVLVEKDGRSFAASMHGMPHGGDGIPGNGFSGHFCVHFLGSTTHRSKSVDPDHQWMVYKAAGRLEEGFRLASPYAVTDSFLIAINQQDPQLLRYAFGDTANPQLEQYISGIDKIKAIRRIHPFRQQDTSGQLGLELPVDVTVHEVGRRPKKQKLTFHLKRSDESARWVIERIEPPSFPPAK